MEFQKFIENWGYLGVFLGILASGLGLPLPEELPIVVGGAMTHHDEVYWWIMLPVCIIGVIIGDSFLYFIGRFWGARLVQLPFIRKKLLTPERFAKISSNFQEFGVKILLFARLTPGIRAPIFLTAGITKLPMTQFLLADGIYAIPGVSILFWLGYWFTDSIIDLIKEDTYVKPILALVFLAGITLYVLYRFWRRPVVTGNPSEMPPIVGPVTVAAENIAESMAGKVLHRVPLPEPTPLVPPKPKENKGAAVPPATEKKPASEPDKPESKPTENNGSLHPTVEDKKPASEPQNKSAG